jgi:GTP-dependent phosphoenolpyruvate carboxykinase
VDRRARRGHRRSRGDDPEEWKAEVPLIEEWFRKIGDKTPSTLLTELDALKARLGLDAG